MSISQQWVTGTACVSPELFVLSCAADGRYFARRWVAILIAAILVVIAPDI